MQKNQEKEGLVVAFGANGEGIVKENEYVVFVPFSIIGEKIKYKVLKVSGNIVYGKLLSVLTPSENRITPVCEVFGKCGGCQLQHINYERQLKLKEQNISDAFRKIAFLDVKPENAVVGKSEFRYRNKLQLPVADVDGKTVIGFYAENSHRVVPISDCYINPTWTKKIISAFKTYFELCGVKGYDEKTRRGEVREITVKEIKGKLIIAVVIACDKLKNEDKLIEILDKTIDLPYSLYLNVNKSSGNAVFGDKFLLLKGSPSYDAEMLGVKYKIGVKSFMQVNSEVCEKLYKTVQSEINPDEKTTVIDAYSGAGLMTAVLSKKAERAIGIEIIPEAVKLADELKKENGLEDKITNYLGKCEDILPDLIRKEKLKGNKTSLVLDPPRKGCDRRVLQSIIDSGIEKIVYVSCLPQSLARDVGLLVGTLELGDSGIKKSENPKERYEIEKIIPFDMFPNTKHIETLCVLRKKIHSDINSK